jgi:hypothetical protein
VYEQLQRSREMSLQQAFQMELVMALNTCRFGNFREGVRALLIEKDRKPGWQPDTLNGVSGQFIDEHFRYPWGEVNPLADLA